jgi:peptidoglycan/LPS O-acetylase OafA/YrhL
MVVWWIPQPIGTLLAIGIPGVAISWVLILLSIAAITPLAALSYAFVERPGMDLGRRVMSNLSSERSHQSSFHDAVAFEKSRPSECVDHQLNRQ